MVAPITSTTALTRRTAVDRAIDGTASAPLSREQIRRLVILQRKCFDRLPSAVRADTVFDSWRYVENRKACGVESLRCCCNHHYKLIRAHFLALLGFRRAAAREHVAARSEPRTWAEAKLRTECASAADVLPGAWNYAAGFLRKKRGLEISTASEKDLWQAVFLVRRRAQQLRRQRKVAS